MVEVTIGVGRLVESERAPLSWQVVAPNPQCWVSKSWSAGDAIHFESSRLHEVANPTKKTAQFICMMTPPQL